MGKKGKGKGKKSGGKTSKSKKSGNSSSLNKEEEQTPKEVLLKNELDQLTQELETVKDKVKDLRLQNEFLQKEANQIRTETHEYVSYMSKKANKRQDTIISLNDWNQQELEKVNRQKEDLVKKYTEEKDRLKGIIMEKEAEMANIRAEIENMSEYKTLQEEQLAEIKDLNQQVMTMRTVHSENIQKIRADFLKEKTEFKDDSEKRISEMKRLASKEAVKSLVEHTNRVKEENRALRTELMELIKLSQALQSHKKELTEQRKKLLIEQEYNSDIKKIRESSRRSGVNKNSLPTRL